MQKPSFEVVLNVDELVQACFGAAQASGWWTDLATGEPLNAHYTAPQMDAPSVLIPAKINVGEKLMLIVSEVAEAMEGDRKNLMDQHLLHRKSIEVELADALIRICDLAGGMQLDLGGAVAEKLAYNASRADHQIENRKGENGKKY